MKLKAISSYSEDYNSVPSKIIKKIGVETLKGAVVKKYLPLCSHETKLIQS